MRPSPLIVVAEVVVGLLCLAALVAGLASSLAGESVATWWRIIIALGATEVVLIWVGLTGTILAKLRARRRGNHTDRHRPEILAALTHFAAGEDTMPDLVALARQHRVLVEDVIADVLRTMAPDAREPIVHVALALDVVARWRRQSRAWARRTREQAVVRLGLLPPTLALDALRRAVDDKDERVRRAAIRGVIRSGDHATVADVVAHVAGRSVSERALVVDGLTEHPLLISPGIFAPALASGDAGTMLATLAMVRGCGRTIDLPVVRSLLAAPNAAVRAAAADTAAHCTCTPTLVEALTRAAHDPTPDVRAAALRALARLAPDAALIAVARGLRAADPNVAVTSARALGTLGAPGRRRLEGTILWGPDLARDAAVEGLSHAMTETGERAR